MNRDRESAADRLWKEKLDEFASAGDSILFLSLAGAVLLVLIIVA